jgi:hypothetical protein
LSDIIENMEILTTILNFLLAIAKFLFDLGSWLISNLWLAASIMVAVVLGFYLLKSVFGLLKSMILIVVILFFLLVLIKNTPLGGFFKSITLEIEPDVTNTSSFL